MRVPTPSQTNEGNFSKHLDRQRYLRGTRSAAASAGVSDAREEVVEEEADWPRIDDTIVCFYEEIPSAPPGTEWVPFLRQGMYKLEVTTAELREKLADIRARQKVRQLREKLAQVRRAHYSNTSGATGSGSGATATASDSVGSVAGGGAVVGSVDSGGGWGATTLTPTALRTAAMLALDEVKRRSGANMDGPPTADTLDEYTRAPRKQRCTKYLKTVHTG